MRRRSGKRLDYLHQFLFGIYPYIAAVIFLFGSLVRFEREQYRWKSESVAGAARRLIALGNILFGVGILGLFFGHLVGLLMPVAVRMRWASHTAPTVFAMVAGGLWACCVYSVC